MINDGQYDIVETEDTFIVNTWVLDKNSKNLIFTRNEDKVTWFRPEVRTFIIYCCSYEKHFLSNK
jgi:hypothetical protein